MKIRRFLSRKNINISLKCLVIRYFYKVYNR
nr:MAG TPA: hypothetical protein [Caudoviricetes sp.]